MRNLRRHADALAQRRVRVDGLADIQCVCAHRDGQCNLADHVARVGAVHAAAQNLAVAVRLRTGGQGLYLNELFVAIIVNEQFFLKADVLSRPDFEAADCLPFCYLKDGAWMSMGYFCPPEEAMESRAEMLTRARLAQAAALRAASAKALKPA